MDMAKVHVDLLWVVVEGEGVAWRSGPGVSTAEMPAQMESIRRVAAAGSAARFSPREGSWTRRSLM
jgi:hypothetical protein